jgi:hypothetical protein
MMGTRVRRLSALPDDLSLGELVPEDHFYCRLEVQRFEKAVVVAKPRCDARPKCLPPAGLCRGNASR